MNKQKTYYITTPIYYVNDSPHIGHAYTSLACDVIARFKRLDGFAVKFLTGTDEHGQKVEKAALAANKSPQNFVDEVSVRFRKLGEIMHFTNDDFIRTTEERHKKAAIILWQKLQENGHIYLSKYAGWYSVRDEAFYAEGELIEGKAPTGAPVEWVEESSYFFDLSKWQDKLLELYEERPDFIMPESRRNEVISFVKGGLNDLSISRTSFKWGVPVPGDNNHIMYVWIEALANYISAIGYGDENAVDFNKFWPANIHMVGKDIVRFHAVYWPAILMAAGIELPKRIFAHGWWTNEGQKISKSLGNIIDPLQLVEEFGVDQVRYFFMREIPFGNDGNFSRDSLINRINSELSNNIGNLLQRTTSLIQKNCDGTIASSKYIDLAYQQSIVKDANLLLSKVRDKIELQDFPGAIELIINIANQANIFIDREAPWLLAKTDDDRMRQVLYIIMEVMRYIAILLQPFTPESASKILNQLNIPLNSRDFACLNKENAIKFDKKLSQPSAIFPRFNK